MSFKDLRRRKYSKKKKYKKPRCEKQEYFNKKTGICKTKTKRSTRPSKGKKSKRKKKKSESIVNTLSNSNSSNVFDSSIINSVPKKTRFFLILGHSSLCYRVLHQIKSGREDKSKRLDLKTEPVIKDIDNLRVVNIQSMGLNSTSLVYSLINFLNENEKFHSAFIQMNSIEKAEILDKFMKYLFLQTTTIGRFTLSEEKKNTILKLYDSNITSFKVYPKPDDEDYPQNPLNASFSFYPQTEEDDELNKFGVYELTIDNYELLDDEVSVFGDDYIINPILNNRILNNLYINQKKTPIKKKEDPELIKVRNFLGIPDEWETDFLKDEFNEIELLQFNHFIKINIKIFEEIKKKYKTTKNIREATKFNQRDLLKIAIEEGNVLKSDNVIFIDAGCKGIRNLPYKKGPVIPSTGIWESSVRFDPFTTGPLGYNKVRINADMPYKYRKLFQNINPSI